MAMSADDAMMSERERAFWLKRRQALLIELAAIEDHLDIERSITSKRQRAKARRCAADQQVEQQQTTS